MEFLVRDLRIDVMMLLLVIYLIAKKFNRRNESIVYTQGTTEPQNFESLYKLADEALKQSKKYRFGTITINELSERQR